MNAFIVAKRLIKQIRGDKRSLGLMFMAPIFVMFLLNVILTSATTKPNIDVLSVPHKFQENLKKDAHLRKVDTEQEAKKDLREKKADAYISIKDNVPTIVVEGTDPTKTRLVVMATQKALMENLTSNLTKLRKSLVLLSQRPMQTPPAGIAQTQGQTPSTGTAKTPASGITQTPSAGITQTPSAKLAQTPAQATGKLALPKLSIVKKPVIKYYYGSEDFETFDSLAPLLMGFFIFFFVFLIAGISFLRERISGTLDRVLATPLRRGEIVFGYFLGFGVFVAIQTVLIQLFIIYGLKVLMAGSFWLVLVLNLLLATVALSLGTFLSAYARNEFQLIQFIPIVIVPQILFSGIFDLGQAPAWAVGLSKIFPLTYAAEALRDVMIRGFGFSDVQKDIYILVAYALAFLFLNTIALRKYRRV